MSRQLHSLSWFRSLKIWTIALGVGWTATILFLLGWDLHQIRTQVLELAVVDARTSFERDLAFRRWAARHGGVYVPMTPETPPSPYLAHVPERDVQTPSGRPLTLMNSAYISRQLHSWYDIAGSTRTHVTSLKPLRPGNGPDEWETAALQSFQRGETEVVTDATFAGQRHVRLMRPVMVEEACLKCHAPQGYKLGEVLGGVSVSVPMSPYDKLGVAASEFSAAAYALIWFIGLTGIAAGGLVVHRRALAQQAANEARIESERERARLSEQLIQAQKLESMGRLAGGVAHDFNNMISPIMGYTEILLAQKPEGHPDRPALQEILDATLRARDLTQQLLACGRRQPLVERPMDLNVTIRGFETALRQQLRENITLDMRLAPSLKPLRGDYRKIEQVLLNLAINARDAMPQGGRLCIETANVVLRPDDPRVNSDWPAGPYVLATVSDTGSGMDQQTLQRIFEPFFTTKPTGKGTGLGLPTVYGIVKQHRGQIEVESEPGRGTTFRVYLPQDEKE